MRHFKLQISSTFNCVNHIGLSPLNLKMVLRACIYLAPHVLLMQCNNIIMLCTRNNIVKLQGLLSCCIREKCRQIAIRYDSFRKNS